MSKFSKEEIAVITNSVKNDSVEEFGALIKVSPEIFNLSFGRFPILSFVYLYNAKRIAKKYFEDFTKTTYYIEASEPLEAYQKFKALAGIHLRKYCNNKITPAEMLALTKQTNYLVSKFGDLRANTAACKNIESVYNRYGREAHIEYGQIKVSAEPFNKKQKVVFFGLLTVIFVFTILFSVLIGVVFNRIGFGTESRPFYIYNVYQLKAAANTSDHFVLQNDLILPDDFYLSTFNARLNGQGNTIYLAGDSYIIGNLNGTIRNTNFNAVANSYISVSSNFAFVVRYNRGVIEKINLILDVQIAINNLSDTVIGGLVFINYGSILDSTVSGYLGVNSSNTFSVTVGGIAAVNSFAGTGSARRNAVIGRSDSLVQILLTAYNAGGNTVLELGGIVAQNSGYVHQNKFDGVLRVTHHLGVSDTGGIAAINNDGILRNNGSFGYIISVVPNLQTYYADAFAGGIVSLKNSGRVVDNFSLASIEGGENIIVGGIIAAVRAGLINDQGYLVFSYDVGQLTSNQNTSNFYVEIYPYVVRGLGLMFATAAGQIFTGIINDDLLFMRGVSHQEIRQLSIFWDRRGG